MKRALLILLALSGVVSAQERTRREREVLAAEADTLFRRQEFEPARRKWEEALAGASNRDVRRWRPWVARTYEAEGNFQKALAAYQDAYDVDPDNVERLVDLARLYDTVGLDEQALQRFEEAYARDRSRRDVAMALARLHYQAGRLTAAVALAQTAAESDPRDVSAQILLARIEESRGQLASAAKRWEAVLSQAPSADGYLALGRLWARQDAFDSADLSFARAERAGLASPELLLERAVLAWRQGDSPRARLYLGRLLGETPGFFPGQFVGALLDLEANRPDQARDRMRTVFPPDSESEALATVLESTWK